MSDTYNKTNKIDVAIVNFLDERLIEAQAISRNEFDGTPEEITSEMTPILDRQKFADLYEALKSISSNEMSFIVGKYVRLLYIYHNAYQGILGRGSVSSAEIPSIISEQAHFNKCIFTIIAKGKEYKIKLDYLEETFQQFTKQAISLGDEEIVSHYSKLQNQADRGLLDEQFMRITPHNDLADLFEEFHSISLVKE